MDSLMAAVPAYSILYFPQASSIYHFAATCGSGSGIVVTKPLWFTGDVWPTFNGTTMYGSIVDVSINFVNFTGGIYRLGTDCRAIGASAACDGVVWYGSIGNTVDEYTYVGTGLTNAAHGVVEQFGFSVPTYPSASIKHIRAYNVDHGVVVKGTNTTVDDVYCWDCDDILVRGATGSGDAHDNSVSNVRFVGDTAWQWNGAYVLEADTGYNTYNNNATNISCEGSKYCVMAQALGGNIYNNSVANVNGGNFSATGYGVWTYASGAGTCTNLQVTGASFDSTPTAGWSNAANCTNLVVPTTPVDSTFPYWGPALGVLTYPLPANTLTLGCVEIPYIAPLTGVQFLNGGTLSGNVKVALYNNAGTLIASSGSTAQAGVSVFQYVPFTTPYTAAPGRYCFGVVPSSATATFMISEPWQASNYYTQGSFTLPSSLTVPPKGSAQYVIAASLY
jgi:hypothetical protein